MMQRGLGFQAALGLAGNLRQPENVMAACCMVFRLHQNNNRQPENSLLGCTTKTIAPLLPRLASHVINKVQTTVIMAFSGFQAAYLSEQ
nr:hypothetical protein [uncultured Kingella sp.]